MKDQTFNEAKQFYLEQYASAIVTSGFLKVAVTILSVVILGLVLLNLKMARTVATVRPLVIRIDEIGRAQAVAYDSLAYQPQYKETKYFLTRFCQLFYRRNRSTINDDFTQAMYFLDGKLADDLMQQFKRGNVIKSFLADNLAPETDIDVQQVIVEPMEKLPYKATVDFFKTEYSPTDHSVSKRRLYTASLVFSFRDQVPNSEILTNPLGLTISYFREDEAFLK